MTASAAHCPVASNLKSTVCDELTATFDPTMRFKRSNSNLENFMTFPLNHLHALEVAQRLERVSNLVSSKELDKIACKVG